MFSLKNLACKGLICDNSSCDNKPRACYKVWRTELCNHDDVIKWKHFPIYWPLCAGNPPFTGGEFPRTKASDAELWCFLWSAPEETVK